MPVRIALNAVYVSQPEAVAELIKKAATSLSMK
jgi:hypothetical protein